MSTRRAPSDSAFRQTQWDPALILLQIASLQTAYWAILGVCVLSLCLCFDEVISLEKLFDYREVSLTSPYFSFASFFGFLLTAVLW